MARPFRFSLSAGRAPRSGREWTDLARKAEDLGFSTLAIPDHLDDQFAPIPALAAASQVTTRLRLQTLVLGVDYRHPALVAKEAATLDVLSDGRVELGLGAGWMTTDYATASMALDRPTVRIDRLSEAVAIVKNSFAPGPFSFTGEHYTICDFDGLPRPLQQPRPPILLAGGGQKMLRLAAREADIVGVNVSLAVGEIDARAGASATPTATDRKLGWIRDAAGSRFAQIELQVRVYVAMITDDREAIADAMAPAMGISPGDALSSPHALVGPLDQVCDDLIYRRERWGFSYIGFGVDKIDAMAPVVARLAAQ